MKACYPPRFVVEKEAWKLKGTLCTSAAVRLLMGPFINQLSALTRTSAKTLLLDIKTAAILSQRASTILSTSVRLAAKSLVERLVAQVLIWQSVSRGLTSTLEDSSSLLYHYLASNGTVMVWRPGLWIDVQLARLICRILESASRHRPTINNHLFINRIHHLPSTDLVF